MRERKEKFTKEKVSKLLSNILIHFILTVVLISALIPLYYMAINVFKSPLDFARNPFGLPSNFYIGNLYKAWVGGEFTTLYKNTIIVAGVTVTLTLFLGSLAAFAFATRNFRGKNFFYSLVIIFMFISMTVFIIPLYVQMRTFKLVNTLRGVSGIYMSMALPFTIFVLTAVFKGLPTELFDQARIDGCSDFAIYYKIVLPLSTPALLTVSLLNLLTVWNDLLIALVFLAERSKWTLMVGIVSFSSRLIRNPLLSLTGLSIATIPIVILYIFLQKYFAKGLILGALK